MGERGLGTLIDPDKVPDWVFIKSEQVSDGRGGFYVCGATPTGTPVVKSLQTGRLFLLQPLELVELAKRAGIDNTNVQEG